MAHTLGTAGCWHSARGRSPSYTLYVSLPGTGIIDHLCTYSPSLRVILKMKTESSEREARARRGETISSVAAGSRTRHHGAYVIMTRVPHPSSRRCRMRQRRRERRGSTCASQVQRTHTWDTAEASAVVKGGRRLQRGYRKDGSVISRLVCR